MGVEPVRLGFIGFGEAASRFAKDLGAAGLSGIAAYSRSAAKTPAVREKVADAGVELVPTVKSLCERSTLIIALTPGAAALSALRKALPHLSAGHIYVDASTSSVKAMGRRPGSSPKTLPSSTLR